MWGYIHFFFSLVWFGNWAEHPPSTPWPPWKCRHQHRSCHTTTSWDRTRQTTPQMTNRSSQSARKSSPWSVSAVRLQPWNRTRRKPRTSSVSAVRLHLRNLNRRLSSSMMMCPRKPVLHRPIHKTDRQTDRRTDKAHRQNAARTHSTQQDRESPVLRNGLWCNQYIVGRPEGAWIPSERLCSKYIVGRPEGAWITSGITNHSSIMSHITFKPLGRLQWTHEWTRLTLRTLGHDHKFNMLN